MASFIGADDFKNCKVLRQLFAEFLGTFLYLSLCVLVGSDHRASNITVAFANGLLVSCVVQLIGNVSGGHVNPAVTVSVLVAGHIKLLKALCYVGAQAMGAIAGAAVAYALSDQSQVTLGATIPHPDLSAHQVFGLELIMTFILTGVALSVCDPVRGSKGLGSAALAIGLSVTACQCACLSYTGSLNPVRSLGPAVVMNIWTFHWVYWLAPLIGGLMSGAVYRFVLNFKSQVEIGV